MSPPGLWNTLGTFSHHSRSGPVVRICSVALWYFILWQSWNLHDQNAFAGDSKAMIKNLCGSGAVGVWDENGKILFAINAEQLHVPASILKIATALFVLDQVGPDFRFETLFLQDAKGTLYVKGFGDPSLTSETWTAIVDKLIEHGLTSVHGIVLDDSYFATEQALPGVGQSTNPFDAMNGALVSNFNTINVTVAKDGTIASAEPQTPLTPFMTEKAREKKVSGTDRINITDSRSDCLRLTDSLIRAFLMKKNVPISGETTFSTVPDNTPLLYCHRSSGTVAQAIKGMLEFSNNFTANQLFLIMGARLKGAPATLGKAQSAMTEWLSRDKNLKDMTVIEGSGISRSNQASVHHMETLLRRFLPWRTLLPLHKGAFVKTGTLRDVQSLAGYVPSTAEPGKSISFAIMLHGANKNRWKIFDIIASTY